MCYNLFWDITKVASFFLLCRTFCVSKRAEDSKTVATWTFPLNEIQFLPVAPKTSRFLKSNSKTRHIAYHTTSTFPVVNHSYDCCLAGGIYLTLSGI